LRGVLYLEPSALFAAVKLGCQAPISSKINSVNGGGNMESDNLKEHVFKTYFNLRVGIGLLSILFPILLWIVGSLKGVKLQDSMSAYYHANNVTRDIFVGILCAIGFFLCLYRGFTIRENWALNLAGIFAIGVAFFPMQWNCGDACTKFSLHGFFAISLFLCMAYVCIRCASETLPLLNDKKVEKRYRKIYNFLGIGMILAPVVAWVLTIIFRHAYTFIAEFVGIAVFASYWLIKSRELSSTQAELKALFGKFKT
jgi:hypothetical protein